MHGDCFKGDDFLRHVAMMLQKYSASNFNLQSNWLTTFSMKDMSLNGDCVSYNLSHHVLSLYRRLDYVFLADKSLMTHKRFFCCHIYRSNGSSPSLNTSGNNLFLTDKLNGRTYVELDTNKSYSFQYSDISNSTAKLSFASSQKISINLLKTT